MSLELSTSVGDPDAGSIEGALAKAQQSFQEGGGFGAEAQQVEQPSQQVEQQAEPQEQAPQGDAQEQAVQELAEQMLEVDYQGEPLKLSMDDAKDLIRHGLEALVEKRRGGGSQQTQQQESRARQLAGMPELPPELSQSLGPYLAGVQRYVDDRVSAIAGVLADERRQAQVKELTSEAQRAMDEHAVFKNVDPESRRLLEGVVMQYRAINEGTSFKTAAAKVAKIFEARDRQATTKFVQTKLKAAKNPVEGRGGAPPTAQAKKFTGKDFSSGALAEAAERRFRELVSQQEQA